MHFCNCFWGNLFKSYLYFIQRHIIKHLSNPITINFYNTFIWQSPRYHPEAAEYALKMTLISVFHVLKSDSISWLKNEFMHPCFYPSWTTLGHAPNEEMDGVLGYLLLWTRAVRCGMDLTNFPRCCTGLVVLFRSGELGGQLMVSISSSSMNCLYTPATWGQALLCT